jgi:hypothetical protein
VPEAYAVYLPIEMRILLFFVASLVLSGCFTQGDCLVSASNLVRIQFKKKNTTKDTSVAVTAIQVSGTDSIIGYKSSSTELLIPLNGKADTTQFILHRLNVNDSTITATDTLTLGYQVQGSVATPDCGAFTYYQNLKVLKFSRGDSLLKLYNRNLAKDPTSQTHAINFWIYF